ncbi:hypothetical protein JXM67_08145 [candidate division WOR-3 bacterium]|nr:hypothetical protein [candidate division WOR-3 bacterium]
MKKIDTETREKLIAFLDGELDVKERSKVAKKLKESALYRRELDSLKQVLALTKVDTAPDLKPVMWSVPSRPRIRWWRWVVAPAAVTVAIIGFLVFGGKTLFEGAREAEFVMINGDTLSRDEGIQLITLIMSEDEELREVMLDYTERKPTDIYNELMGLDEEEEEVLIFLLEEKMLELKRS